MWYLIYSEDVPDSLPLRKQVRPAHLARLQALQDEGRLLTAGPNPAIDAEDPADAGFTGSTVIAEFCLAGGCPSLGRCRSLCGSWRLCQSDHQAVQESLLKLRQIQRGRNGCTTRSGLFLLRDAQRTNKVTLWRQTRD